jgi:hypothetical protein
MDEFRELRIKGLIQETRIIALVDENETGRDEGPIVEKEIILDSNRRPLPVPYTEEP